MKPIRRNTLKNEPGKPIVNRDIRARFYCVACLKEYRGCKCRVYMSADTLKRDVHYPEAQEQAEADS